MAYIEDNIIRVPEWEKENARLRTEELLHTAAHTIAAEKYEAAAVPDNDVDVFLLAMLRGDN